MRELLPEVELIDLMNKEEILKKIEQCGRVCYKSEELITDDSASKFVKMLLGRGHESVIEHISLSAKVICDRGVSHEIVRHRIASYSQESTRYCDYSKEKFKRELNIITPCFWDGDTENDKLKKVIWKETMLLIEENYMKLVELGASAQEARSVLPNSLKTEIVITMNLREWRHFFKLRTSSKAHPQMQEVANQLYDLMNLELPEIFGDIKQIS